MRTSRPFEFDTATAVERCNDRWLACYAEGWDTMGIPNGGYQLAVATSAILAATGQPDVVSLQATYLNPAQPGPVDIIVESTVAARDRTGARAFVHQDGNQLLMVQAITGALTEAAETQHWADASPPVRDAPSAYPRLLPAPDGLPPPLMGHLDLRIPVDQLGFATGTPTGQATISGWARFPDGRPLDTGALPLFADAFPPAVFNSGLGLGWVPTLTLSLQIRQRPVGSWIAGTFTTRAVTDGYLDEDGELWDSTGHLIGLSRQLARMPRP